MNRYSFSGKGNVLIKANSQAKYGNQNFDAKEPIAYFTDVMISVSFANSEKIARSDIKNLAVESKSEPSILTIENIKTSESLLALLYKKEEEHRNNQTYVKKIISSAEGEIFLPIQSDEVLEPLIFIYDENKNRILDFILNDSMIENLSPNTTYIVFYSVEKPAKSTYSLETPAMPYLSAEIHVLGNVNEKTGEVVLHLNTLQLLSRPTLDFNSDNPFVDTLEFVIIHSKEPVEVNYYG